MNRRIPQCLDGRDRLLGTSSDWNWQRPRAGRLCGGAEGLVQVGSGRSHRDGSAWHHRLLLVPARSRRCAFLTLVGDVCAGKMLDGGRANGLTRFQLVIEGSGLWSTLSKSCLYAASWRKL